MVVVDAAAFLPRPLSAATERELFYERIPDALRRPPVDWLAEAEFCDRMKAPEAAAEARRRAKAQIEEIAASGRRFVACVPKEDR